MRLDIWNEAPLTDDETIDDMLCNYYDHDSIKCILGHNQSVEPFELSSVCAEKVKIVLDDIGSCKATAFDNIPPKLSKSASQELAQPISTLVDQCLKISHFPHDLKKS